MFKTYLQYLPKLAQISVFMGLWVAFLLINTLLQSTILTQGWGVDILKIDDAVKENPFILLTLNLVNQIVLFALPALVFAYLATPKPFNYLGFKGKQWFLLSTMILAALIMIPFVSSMSGLIKMINLGGVANQMQDVKEQYIATYLQNSSLGGMVLNLCLMALVPAICEELFFRGVVMKIMLNVNRNPIVAFVVTSLFFALLHNSIYDLLPVFTASMILCMVYYYTGNIANNILLHFLNNGLQVMLVYFIGANEINLPYEYIIMMVTFVLSGLLLYIILSKIIKSTNVSSDDWKMQVQNNFK
jgi:membrane protease YdiL (CAAX protease family)